MDIPVLPKFPIVSLFDLLLDKFKRCIEVICIWLNDHAPALP